MPCLLASMPVMVITTAIMATTIITGIILEFIGMVLDGIGDLGMATKIPGAAADTGEVVTGVVMEAVTVAEVIMAVAAAVDTTANIN